MLKMMAKSIEEVLTRGVEQILPSKKDLVDLIRKKKIRLYLGIDPTSPDIHLGHTLPLRKLKQFQDLGHEVILLVGTFTAQIGDPSEQTEKRKPLTSTQIKKNMATYKGQTSKILDFKRVKIKYNGDWLAKLTFEDLAELASHFTVPQLLERDMFQQKIKAGKEIWLNEFLYPLMQGYDSVAMNVDLEVGATDQTFNMLVGRKLQKIYNKKEKFVLTTPMLAGLDGRKMSKTYGNTVNLTDSPNDMFGKLMSLKDGLIMEYFEFCTDMPTKKIKSMTQEMKKDPMGVKKQLAYEITKMYHGEKEAIKAQKGFEKVFERREAPKTMPQVKIRKKQFTVDAILVKCKLAQSKSEARRLIKQGGVRVDGEKVTTSHKPLAIRDGMVIRVGKRRFVRIKK